MSDSPPPDSKDVEQNAQQSGEEQDNNDRNDDAGPGGGMTDFEVKEQDRWLPIANGMIMSYLSFSLFPICSRPFRDMRVRSCVLPTGVRQCWLLLKTRPLIRLRHDLHRSSSPGRGT
jgi:hypothetical protein